MTATCVSKGNVEYWTCGSPKCAGKFYGDKDCQTELTAVEIPVDANNHTGRTTLKKDKAPTCYQEGYSGDVHCADCDAMLAEGNVISATGKHVPGAEWITEAGVHYHVCTTPGCNTKCDEAACDGGTAILFYV